MLENNYFSEKENVQMYVTRHLNWVKRKVYSNKYYHQYYLFVWLQLPESVLSHVTIYLILLITL